MPTYEYECERCDAKYEIFHPIDMPTLATNLPAEVTLSKGKLSCAVAGCKHKALTKLLSSPNLRTVVKGNHDFVPREQERLTKRSMEHWQAKGWKEAVERTEAKGFKDASKWVPKTNLK